jgi:hypothetical protein
MNSYGVEYSFSQVPWWWLHPLNNGVAHSAREEQTNLLRVAQGASVQVCGTNKMVPTDPLWLMGLRGACHLLPQQHGTLQSCFLPVGFEQVVSYSLC